MPVQAEKLLVVEGMWPGIGLSGRWHPTFCPAAMRQSTAVQLLAKVNIGFSLRVAAGPDPSRWIASFDAVRIGGYAP
jgi:hypothetical protein